MMPQNINIKKVFFLLLLPAMLFMSFDKSKLQNYTLTDLELRMNRNGEYFAEYFGVKPGVVSAATFQAMLNKVPAHSTIKLPVGRITLDKGIVVTKPVKLVGVYGKGWGEKTEIYSEGFEFKGADGSLVKDLHIRGKDRGRGLLISSVMDLEGVTVSHFDKGVEVYGDIYNGNKLDASRTIFRNVTIGVCKTFGLKVVGGDANQCSFYDLDIRDIGGIGLIDASFLGNSYYSAHFNNCKGGAFQVTDVNSRCSFYDVYLEDGMPPSKVTKNTFITARNFATKIEGGYQQQGTAINKLIVNDLMITGKVSLHNEYGGEWNLERDNKLKVWGFNYSNVNHTKIYLLKQGDKYKGKNATGYGFGYEYPEKFVNLYK